jgi:histidinol-phosphate aminotransferase
MIKVNKSVLKTKPYVASNRTNTKEMKKLDWNECNIPLSDEIQKVFSDAIKKVNLTEYPPIGNEKLLQKIAEYCGVKKQNVEIFNGSDSALEYIFSCFVDSDVNVLIYDPNYTQINNLISLQTEKIHRSQIKNILTEPEYDLSAIKKADVVYISNPNNPTGYTLEPKLIEKLVAENKSKLFIIDEAYYEFHGKSCCHLAEKYNNIIVTRTFSKALSLASIRLGYICTDNKNIQIINKIKNKKEVNSFAHALGFSVLENIHLFESRVQIIQQSREYFLSEMKRMNIECLASKANFVLVKLRNHQAALTELLKNKFLVRDRSMFEGLQGCIRITMDTKDNMKTISNILEKTELRGGQNQ